VVLVFTLRDAPQTETTGAAPKVRFGEAIVSLFGSGSFLLMFVFWGLLSVAGWGVVGWMPTYLGEQFHLSQGKAGLSATAYLNTAIALGLLIGGFWADRWSRTRKRARILVPVIGLCIAAPGVLLAANSPVLVLAIAGLMIYGLARPFTDANMMPILCMVSDQRYLATGFGVLNMFACLVGAATIYVGGMLRDAHVDVAHIFRFAAGGLIVCAVLMFLVRTKSEQTTT
jgi:sugar phosphate permease